jgi:hypothetical protein
MDCGCSFFGFSSNDFPSSSENASFELQIKWQISFFKKCLLAISCGHSTRICLCIKKRLCNNSHGQRNQDCHKMIVSLLQYIWKGEFFWYSIGVVPKAQAKLYKLNEKWKISHTQLMNSFPFLYNRKTSCTNYSLFQTLTMWKQNDF